MRVEPTWDVMAHSDFLVPGVRPHSAECPLILLGASRQLVRRIGHWRVKVRWVTPLGDETASRL